MSLSQRHQDLLALYDVTREDWDPNDNTPQKNREVDAIDRIELHHTGGAGPQSLSFADKLAWGINIEAYHEQTKGWTDIFYHVFVFADGETWGGRRPDRYSQGDIRTTLTVHIPGNNAAITPVQAAAVLDLAAWATDDPNMIRVHSDRAATQCPGANARALRRQLQEELPNMATHDHEYQDLSAFADATQAAKRGFWDESNPRMAASRSTVAVVANRVANAAVKGDARLSDQLDELTARVNELTARVAELNEIGNVIEITPEAMEAIVAAIIERLKD